MRLAIVTLLFVGLVAMVIGTFDGCSSLFAWNGRYAIAERSLGPAPLPGAWEGGNPVVAAIVPDPARRYTVSVQVVFDRERVGDDEAARVEAKMPLVVRVKDKTGRSMTDVAGWLDPNERPNVLYGHGARGSLRGPAPDLFVERLVGPVRASSSDPISVEVDLGPDRLQKSPILARRLVVYDDRLPPAIRNALIGAGAGAAAFSAGLGLIALRWWRTRGGPRKRKRDVLPRVGV